MFLRSLSLSTDYYYIPFSYFDFYFSLNAKLIFYNEFKDPESKIGKIKQDLNLTFHLQNTII